MFFPGKVLLATDGSGDAALAARAAVDLTTKTGSELHVVHAWYSVPSTRFDSFVRAQLQLEARELLDAQVAQVEKQGSKVACAYLREGSAVDEVLDLADEIGADLIVMGSRGRGPVKRLVMGSVSEGVVHHARRPVLVLRGGSDAWPPGASSSVKTARKQPGRLLPLPRTSASSSGSEDSSSGPIRNCLRWTSKGVPLTREWWMMSSGARKGGLRSEPPRYGMISVPGRGSE
jgi:nucleotide-binding universal stress UspA family protein